MFLIILDIYGLFIDVSYSKLASPLNILCNSFSDPFKLVFMTIFNSNILTKTRGRIKML